MKLKFVEGNAHQLFLNGVIEGDMDSTTAMDKMWLGRFCIDYKEDKNGKITNKKKYIKIVKQDKWHSYFPILIHEFAHYLVDLIFPLSKYGFDSKHKFVEKYLSINKFYKIL